MPDDVTADQAGSLYYEFAKEVEEKKRPKEHLDGLLKDFEAMGLDPKEVKRLGSIKPLPTELKSNPPGTGRTPTAAQMWVRSFPDRAKAEAQAFWKSAEKVGQNVWEYGQSPEGQRMLGELAAG